jgi:phospholipid/cholesterol/gamma-HCH transport system substrate-binding protein
MISRGQKIRLGIFMSLGLLVIITALVTLSFDRLFSPKDTYYIAFTDQSLSGIDIGSQVKYLGIPVGTVRNLRINPGNINEIIVTVAIEPGTPIREDVRADLQTIGITGMKMIELRAGTAEAQQLEPGSYIRAGRSVTDEIFQRAETIADKIEIVLDNMIEFTEDDTRDKFLSFIDEAQATITNVNRLLNNNQERMERTVSNIDTLTVELNKMVTSVNSLLYQTENILFRNRAKIANTLDELNMTVRYLNDTARSIHNDPSVLIRGKRYMNLPDDRLIE